MYVVCTRRTTISMIVAYVVMFAIEWLMKLPQALRCVLQDQDHFSGFCSTARLSRLYNRICTKSSVDLRLGVFRICQRGPAIRGKGQRLRLNGRSMGGVWRKERQALFPPAWSFGGAIRSQRRPTFPQYFKCLR